MKTNKTIINNPSYLATLNMSIVYRNSIKKILKSPLPYIIFGVTILADAFIFFLWPYVTRMGNISLYYESDTWVILTMQVTFAMFALIGAAIGETNAISSEKIYILSKPIKRGTFLSGKCLSSFTVAFMFALPTMLVLGGVATYEAIARHTNIFDVSKAENPYAIFASFIIILIFSSFISTIWKYQTRGGI
jgi:ABC-type transport system involved in multi-copper enzyme maturation permease subunit